MKKILYVLTSLSHKRCYESFVERKDCVQMVAGPKPKITQTIIPEDYRDFKIKNIHYYSNMNELQRLINKFKPNVYVQASLPCIRGLIFPMNCKKVYVSHGMLGNHVKNIIKQAGLDTYVWKGFDLYCGATKTFADWLKSAINLDSNKVLLNAIPQFDIISSPNYCGKYKDKILKSSKNPSAKYIILFVGLCCRDRYDFQDHNEDYFKSVIKLEELAREHNWLVMVKPRQYYPKMMSFLKTKRWGSKYYKKYAQIQKSKYLHFITTTGHIYRYFFADIFITNGCSTVEVEACVAKKPLIIIRTNVRTIKPYDPYRTSEFGSSFNIDNINILEKTIFDILNGKNKTKEQGNMIRSMGLTIDGNMHKRIQDRLVTI